MSVRRWRPGRGLATVLRLAVGLGLLVFLLVRLEPSRVLASLTRLAWGPVLAAGLAHLAAKLVWTVRWQTLLEATGERRGFWELLRFLFIGIFFNQFLPTSVGGDLVRGYYTSPSGRRSLVGYAVVVAERVLGMITLVATAGVASLIALAVGTPLPRELLVSVAVLGVAGTAGGLVVFAWQGWRTFVARRWQADRLDRWLDAFDLFRQPFGSRVRLVASSLALQIVAVLFYVAAARAVGLTVPALAFFLVVPAAATAAMLPISINGLGVREGVLVALLTALGAPAAEAGSCAVLALLISTAFSLVGGLLYPFYRRRAG